MNRIRMIGKIGKATLITALGIQENIKLVEYEEVYDINECKNCKLRQVAIENGKLDEFKDYCNTYCNKPIKRIKKVTYFNEKNRLKLTDLSLPPKKLRLSRLQLSQFILFHFLGVDKNGIIKNISINEMAEILDCTRKSVLNNIEILTKLGYIMSSRGLEEDLINIGIINYKDYFLEQSDGGTGYIEISKDLLDEIVSIKNVNSLRVLLRQLIAYDNTNYIPDSKRPAKFTYRQYSNFLPDYINYKAIIDKNIANTQNVFDIKKEKNVVRFQLKDDYNIKLNKRNIEKQNRTIIEKYVDTFDLKIPEIDNLVQMSLSYGVEKIENALLEIKEYYIDNNEYIFNLGGLVRRVIEENIRYFSA